MDTGISNCCIAVCPPVCAAACRVLPVRMSWGAAAATGVWPSICPAPLAPALLVVPKAADGFIASGRPVIDFFIELN